MRNKMKRLSLLFISVLFLLRCAAYKELKPKPELTSLSKDFIELKNDKKQFELDKDKKYFITFPAAPAENYYLVLTIGDKQNLHTYLTDTFDDGKGRIIEIPDESSAPQQQSVYAVDNSVQKFYWVVDLVKKELVLKMQYRYVEQWRYQFENKYQSFRQTFEDNKIDSSGFRALGSSFDLQQYDFNSKIARLQNSSAALTGMQNELKAIEAIFPVSVKNTTDQAYQDYLSIKKKLNDEIQFQTDYAFVLQLFGHLQESAPAFVKNVGQYQTFFENQAAYPQEIGARLTEETADMLPKTASYYNIKLKSKKDAKKIKIPIGALKNLIKTAQILPAQSFNSFAVFVQAFNAKSTSLNKAEQTFAEIKQSVDGSRTMPSNLFFNKIITRLSKLQYQLPSAGSKAYHAYSGYACVGAQNRAVKRLRRKVKSLLEKYRYADTLIPKINAYKAQKKYSAMLRLIKKNSGLPFLKSLYKDLDLLTLNTHKKNLKQALKMQDWARAEQTLRSLSSEKNFLNPKNSVPKKNKIAAAFDDSLYNKITRISLARANALMNENSGTVNGVEELYQSAAFLPVYEPTFSVKGNGAAQTRIKNLYGKLNRIKEIEFPQKAISRLYKEFTLDPDDNGVLKARAVVTHGKHYQGSDAKIKTRIGECDPWASKWITKAKTYRKVFALPVTTKPNGSNAYVFRMNIRIPTKAKFPVYDLNIKLPKAIARYAASARWYDKILLNKKVVKNEGRYTVTAPTAANNYEFQITPIRMSGKGDNVLEIHFTHKSFKAFQISVMAQKPIIKKH